MVHSLVAKMSYPDKIGDCEIEKIKDFYPALRSEAKGIEFAIVLLFNNYVLNNFVALYGNIENKLGELQGNIGKSAAKQED